MESRTSTPGLQQFLAESLDVLPDAVFLVQLESRRILYCNEPAAQIFGYPLKELLGDSTAKLHVDHHRYLEFGRNLQNAMKTSPIYQCEYEMRRRDGSILDTEHKVMAVRDRSIDAWISIVRDISHRTRDRRLLEDYNLELKRLTSRIAAIQEEERRRLARELHDEIGQLLTALKFSLEADVRERDEFGSESSANLTLLREIMNRVRGLSLDLRPTMLDDFGLLPALRWQANRFRGLTGIHIEIQSGTSLPRLAPEVETAAYRIAQEALTNVVKHSGADQVRVLAQLHEGFLVLVVEDNGSGIGAYDRLRGTGLSGMRERAAEIGGEFSVEPIPEGGTRICARLPAAKNSESD